MTFRIAKETEWQSKGVDQDAPDGERTVTFHVVRVPEDEEDFAEYQIGKIEDQDYSYTVHFENVLREYLPRDELESLHSEIARALDGFKQAQESVTSSSSQDDLVHSLHEQADRIEKTKLDAQGAGVALIIARRMLSILESKVDEITNQQEVSR